ncbi:MAG: exosortase/archaeosortase family protein [Phycisphaerales bacterium]|nr:exosortase/archaeosortase family protein [Phycisphaerales bacterium]
MRLSDRRGWMKQDYMVLLLLLLLAFFLARGAWIDMLSRAIRDPENGQALFAPIVALYLFWLRRSRLQFIRYRPSMLGPLVIIVGALTSWWGIEKDILLLWHGGAVVLLIGCILTMTGIEVIRQFLPAIICLFFLIPTPGSVRVALAAPLQSFATAVTIGILDMTNVLAVRHGSVILIGEDQIPVAIGEACNGMRMVFALLLVVYGFVFSMPFRLGTRLFLFLVSPFIALACNIFRLFLTSLAYTFLPPAEADSFHWMAGLVMLPLALFLLFGIVRLLKWLDIPIMSWRLAS